MLRQNKANELTFNNFQLYYAIYTLVLTKY